MRIAGGLAFGADCAVTLDPLDGARLASIAVADTGREPIIATDAAKDIARTAAMPSKIGSFPENNASEPPDIAVMGVD